MKVEEVTLIMKALSDTNRVRALLALSESEMCVCRIMELLGLAVSTVSKHMLILKQAGLVESRKSGRWVYYSMSNIDREFYKGFIVLLFKNLKDSLIIEKDKLKLQKILELDITELCKKQRGEKCCV